MLLLILHHLYMIHRMLIVWILPLFPAEPLLGPIYIEVTSYIAPYFLVLLISLLFIDIIYPKIQSYTILVKSIILGFVFCSIFFSNSMVFLNHFLLSDYAKNWFFATGNNIPYFIPQEIMKENFSNMILLLMV